MAGNVLCRKHFGEETFWRGNILWQETFWRGNILWYETFCVGNVLCRKRFVSESFCGGNVLCRKHFVAAMFCGKTFCKCFLYFSIKELYNFSTWNNLLLETAKWTLDSLDRQFWTILDMNKVLIFIFVIHRWTKWV